MPGVFPPAARGWYLVFVLYLAYTLSFVDRTIIAFLVAPIRADLGISDTQFSLLNGLAFVLFYALLGIPIGRLVDAHNRRRIIAIGVSLWSVMTFACGMASTFIQLFLARLGVGVGEAALSPAAISLLADSFPREKRGLAISVFSAGVHGGAGMANIFGGLVVAFALAGGLQVVPLLGELRAWQMAFVLVALPGILVVALLYTVREPPRQEQGSADGRVSFGATLRYLRRHWQVYATLIIGAALAAMTNYGAYSWVPAMYSRLYGWGPGQIGLYFGFITIIAGTSSMVISGMLAGYLLRKGRLAAYPMLMMIWMACGAVPSALLVVIHDPWWTLACLTLMVFFLSAPIGLVQAALQAISPNEMRGQIIAIYLFAVALIGMGCGPTGVAALTDFYFGNDAAVGASIAILVSIAAIGSALLMALAIPAYLRKLSAN